MKKLSKILSESFKDHSQFSSVTEKATASNKNFAKKRPKQSKDFFDFMSLVEKWADIVGEGLIPYTHPLKNKNDMLTVLVSHPGFALQLGFLEESIKSKIFKMFPSLISQIKKINFVTDPEFFKDKSKNENIKMVKMRTHQNSTAQVHSYSPRGMEIKKETEKFLSELPAEIRADQNLTETLQSLFVQFKSRDDDSVS